MKKAQLTMFIIIGIVMIAAVGMALWIGGQITTRRTEPGAEEQRLRQVAVQPVKEYIQSCLDITTMTGLELLGKQGGVLYQNQGGLTVDVQPEDEGHGYLMYDGLAVTYLIEPPTKDIGQLYFWEPPEYPFVTFPHYFEQGDVNTEKINRTLYVGYFGIPSLAPLHKPGEESIQEQLESYINNSLPLCTDWSSFEQQGLVITAGMPNATITIAENLSQVETEQFFTVFVNWEVNITDLTGGNITIDQFSMGYPVHLAKFYLFVRSIVLEDVGNSSFDPRNVSTEATPVMVIEVNSERGDDIIIVQDRASQLRGKPLEFRILRKNRIPALEWINSTDLKDYEFIPAAMCDISQDNIELSQEEIAIHLAVDSPETVWRDSLAAADPDEDAITFWTPAPARLPKPSGLYRMYLYASDGIEEDYQILNLTRANCPTG